MPRYPLDVRRVGPGGGFDFFRPLQGVTHFGLDMAGGAGATVRAPESGIVEASWDFGSMSTTGTHPRLGRAFTGYGPAGVLIRGDSGVYHLLAHLASFVEGKGSVVGEGERVAEGEAVGQLAEHVGASGPHVHWEVRRKPIDSPATRRGNTLDPDAWVRGVAKPASSGGGGLVLLLLLLALASRRK